MSITDRGPAEMGSPNRGPSRGQMMREARRSQQFAKFRIVQLNLIPLVDTFVSVVFFALTTQTLGDETPLVKGVNLPQAQVEALGTQQLTLGIGSNPAQLTLGGRPIMSVQQAALAEPSDPGQPLVIPPLYSALKAAADSIRESGNTPSDQSVPATLAIQGDKTMRYDLLARVLQTARMAGFKNLTLQVLRDAETGGATQNTT